MSLHCSPSPPRNNPRHFTQENAETPAIRRPRACAIHNHRARTLQQSRSHTRLDKHLSIPPYRAINSPLSAGRRKRCGTTPRAHSPRYRSRSSAWAKTQNNREKKGEGGGYTRQVWSTAYVMLAQNGSAGRGRRGKPKLTQIDAYHRCQRGNITRAIHNLRTQGANVRRRNTLQARCSAESKTPIVLSPQRPTAHTERQRGEGSCDNCKHNIKKRKRKKGNGEQKQKPCWSSA